MSSSRPVAVAVEDVGKRYRIGPWAHGHTLLAERITELGASIRSRIGKRGAASAAGKPTDNLEADDNRWLWALRHLSFEVSFGENLGIVGHNGAGKTTLLKLMAHVTTPTEGRIRMYGRVTSLLAVGTGFHPQLSGRENVFLNASLLGLSRQETARRFDEIVSFSGVERFLDMPVKHYSSGMYARLAFSVAAHLDPDILLVDEVLSVGDATFRERGMEKLRALTGEGRTVVFVSHSLGSVESLCDRVILLERGNLEAEGNPQAVITEYMNRMEQPSGEAEKQVSPLATRSGDQRARLIHVRLGHGDADRGDEVSADEPFRIMATFEVRERVEGVFVEFGLAPASGDRFAAAISTDGGGTPLALPPGAHEITADISVHLQPGEYRLEAAMLRSCDGGAVDAVPDALRFSVVEGDTTWSPTPGGGAYLRLPATWRHGMGADMPSLL